MADGVITLSTAYGANMSHNDREILFGELRVQNMGRGASRRETWENLAPEIFSSINMNGGLNTGYPDPGANWYLLRGSGMDDDDEDGIHDDEPNQFRATTWNLPITSFSHEFKTESVQLPLPVEDRPSQREHSSGVLVTTDNMNSYPDFSIGDYVLESNELIQLRNKLLDYGMRSEHIVLDGRLTTERNAAGLPNQPTRAQLLDAIRGQWIVTLDGPGGGVENPLNYMLLTLPGVPDELYRVFITSVNTTRRGGFAGVWDFKLSLYVVKNPNPW